MSDTPQDLDPPAFLTTKEVADLLRVRERKVYDLAAEGDIPHRRITGKLLFPRKALMSWVSGDNDALRPNVATGSHDPLLDWALGASGAGMATLWNGSRPGLDAFARGEAALAALHLPDATGWNIESVDAVTPRDSVLLEWATRARGLLVTSDKAAEITSLDDLRGRRVAMRQPGAGAALLFERLCSEAGLSATHFQAAPPLALTEADAAGMVARGEADAALGIAAMAGSFGLGFVPLVEERVDLLVCRRAYFEEGLQNLIAFARTEDFKARAAALGGYDVTHLGTTRWIGP